MTKHTQEPWHADGVYIGGEYTVAVVSPIDGITNEQGEGYANARRIVACVNACAGLSDAALDSGVVVDAINALRRIADETCDHGPMPFCPRHEALAVIAKLRGDQ